MARISRTFRTRLPATVDQQLMEFCATWDMPASAAIRLAVTHLVQHPEQVVEQLAGVPMDAQQQAAWEALEASLAHVDLEALGHGPEEGA